MFSKLRKNHTGSSHPPVLQAAPKKLTPSMIISVIALVFAMSGGAYAASKVLITSPKQISPKVLKALQGKAGKAGANGAQGPAGAAGPQGPGGAAGAKGENGAAGATGAPGGEGKEGKEGKTGFAATLPSGKTLTGQYSATSFAKGALNGAAQTAVTFPFRVENESGEGPFASYIKKGQGAGEGEEKLPPGCTGNFPHPGAKPDHLCVFENTDSNVTTLANGGAPLFCDYTLITACPLTGLTHVSTTGFGLNALAEAEGVVFIQGTWAVTAE